MTNPPLSPPVEGRYTYLRPILADDYELIRGVEMSAGNAITYRQRGASLSPEQFNQSLWAGVVAQFMIVEIASNAPVGVVACYRPDYRNASAYFAGVVFPGYSSGRPLEGIALFLDYVFKAYPFRKIYGESLEPNFAQFSSMVGTVAHVEGRLRSHEYYDGAYVDQVIIAIYRDEWIARRAAEPVVRSKLASILAQRLSETETHHDLARPS